MVEIPTMYSDLIDQRVFIVARYLLFYLIFHSTFLIKMAAADKVYPVSYVHYVHRHPHHSPSVPTDTDPKFLSALLERSRAQRDTYDERQKLVSTYKIISKTQCLLQMRPSDGHVDAKHITNLDDSKETKDGK